MKTIKYLMLALVTAASFSACVVRESGNLYIRGHYEVGYGGGRHWVPAHYERR